MQIRLFLQEQDQDQDCSPDDQNQDFYLNTKTKALVNGSVISTFEK